MRCDKCVGWEKDRCLIAVPIRRVAGVAKLADAPDLGSGGAILRGSSPLPGTLPNDDEQAHQEIKRKFLIRKLPRRARALPAQPDLCRVIWQSVGARRMVRLRKRGRVCTLTFKRGPPCARGARDSVKMPRFTNSQASDGRLRA